MKPVDWRPGRWRRLLAERENVAANLAAARGQMLPDVPMTALIAEAIDTGSQRLAQIDAELSRMDPPDMVAAGEVHGRGVNHGTVDARTARRQLERRRMAS